LQALVLVCLTTVFKPYLEAASAEGPRGELRVVYCVGRLLVQAMCCR
jgi:hypothetical protein